MCGATRICLRGCLSYTHQLGLILAYIQAGEIDSLFCSAYDGADLIVECSRALDDPDIRRPSLESGQAKTLRDPLAEAIFGNLGHSIAGASFSSNGVPR